MSLARKQAWISGGAWLAISVALLVVSLRAGPEGLAGEEHEGTRALVGGIILPGYLINFAIYVRSWRGRRRGEMDERDKAVERQAAGASLIVVLIAVYVAAIALYEHYHDAGAVPVGWLYLLAYGLIAFVSLVHPALALFVDYTGRVDA